MGAVLIVDDSAADRALLRTVLGRAGYTVHEVGKGAEAVPKAREVRPHLIILDVNLPDMNGLAVCHAIRDDDTDVLAGLEAGADDYVAKDSAPAIVLGRVRRLIQFRQMFTMSMLNQQLVQVGRLLAGIVHEIRGPLAVIRGSAELLLYSSPPTSEDHQWVDAILRNSQLLQLRLDHLMATVRNTSSNPHDIELPSLLNESVQLFLKGVHPGGQKLNVEIACGGEIPPVRIDPGRLMQVLFNLLSNAQQALVRLNRPGRILVKAGTTEAEGKRWCFVDIVDDGPGVPEAFIDRVFEPFFTTRDDGTGYGLYLAAELIKEQSGRLTVRNNDDRGATFTIWLPQQDRPASDASADQAPE
jgi:signal transduction histidine kinase